MNLKSLVLIGSAALFLAACSSSDDGEAPNDNNRRSFTFAAGMPNVEKGTRTSFDIVDDGHGKFTYTPLWSAREEMSVLYGDDMAAQYAGTNTEQQKHAQFEFVGTDNPLAPGQTIVAVNKLLTLENGGAGTRGIEIGDGDAPIADKYSAGVITTTFNCHQQLSAMQKIDEKSEILVSAPVKLTEETTSPVPLTFKRLNGIICLNVKAKGDVQYSLNNTGIKEVQLTTEDANGDFGGVMYINVSDGSFTTSNGEMVSVKSATGDIIGTVGDKNTPIYVCVLPLTINSGSSFKIFFQTNDGRTYERVLKASGDVLVPAGKVTTFNVSFGDADLKVINNPKTLRNKNR